VPETTSHHAPKPSRPILTSTPSVTLYRIVRTDPSTVRDFTSKAALGLVDPDADAETRRLESGLSMYRTLAQARRKARAFPFLGGSIATVRFPSDAPFQVERTTASAGHHTVWGDASELWACVVAVEPVTG
jgi:hypothetical protein